MAKITILGAGSWGTALAILLAQSDHAVCLWSVHPQGLRLLEETHRHKNLPQASLPEAVQMEADLDRAMTGRDAVVFAVPSVYIQETAEKAAQAWRRVAGTCPLPILISASKGIDRDRLLPMTDLIEEAFRPLGPVQTVALSGPTHAEEVALGLPASMVAASLDQAAAREVQALFMNDRMRVYTNSDPLGVELCGALKNVMALAAGMSDGLGLGDNAKAALITRGMAEIYRLGMAMGAKPDTFYGLAGMGDLIVTATSRHSRNNRAGHYIGAGASVEEALERVGQVVEGVYAVRAAVILKEKYAVSMPIVDAVYAVLHHDKPVSEAVMELMRRKPKREDLQPGSEESF